eukprot:6174931-Pleurochrysis_carterae.AAC.1
MALSILSQFQSTQPFSLSSATAKSKLWWIKAPQDKLKTGVRACAREYSSSAQKLSRTRMSSHPR